jgi:hypothetical protein
MRRAILFLVASALLLALCAGVAFANTFALLVGSNNCEDIISFKGTPQL